MRPQPNELDILKKCDIHRGRLIVRVVRWNGKVRIVGLGEPRSGAGSRGRNNRGILAGSLYNELLRRGRLRHGKADFGSVRNCVAVGRVMQTEDNIRAGGYQLPSIPTAVIVHAIPGNVAKIVV